ncbi:MAG: PCRF domain-containing protein, partial [Eubacteriales bacterium]
MLEFEEYKTKLNYVAPDLEELGKALNLDAIAQELDMLQAESGSDGFWDNVEKAQKIQQRVKQLSDKIEKQEKRQEALSDLYTLCEMGAEEGDPSLVEELEEGYDALVAEIEEAKLATLLTGQYDRYNAILTNHPGAGGT